MRKVIKNGIVITMDSSRDKYEKKDIVIDDDEIVNILDNYIGEYDTLIDASDKIIMPGLINAHTHLGMSYFRASNDCLSLQEWLNKRIWPIEEQMSDEDTYLSSLLALIEMIKTGTTCCNDMYYNCEGTIRAIKELKVRCLFTRCLLDNDHNGKERMDDFIRLYHKYKNEELISFCVSPHALYTCNFYC